MDKIVRKPIKGLRVPAYKYPTEFRTCELCYGQGNCCRGAYTSGDEHSVLTVPIDFDDWDTLEESIKAVRGKGKYVRLVTEKAIPDTILWATSYHHRNLLQINVNMQKPIDSLVWTTNLAHAAERCGLFFVYMVYPILPMCTKTYDVLMMIDTIRSIPHCTVLLRFALFEVRDEVPDEYLNINGKLIPKGFFRKLKSGLWECTEEFRKQFIHKIQAYTRFQRMDIEVCSTE